MSRLLLVDDNPQNQYLAKVLLSANGFDVELASNGAEALDAARRSPPDLIVSDILMPVMDGYSFCRACKDDQELCRVPFIFYTATYTDARDEAFALSLGAECFVTKPAEPAVFLAAIMNAGRGRKQPPVTTPTVEEPEYYREYNAVLVRKLESKMLQLEATNRALEADIAERRKTEESLRQSENKYKTLVESIPQKIFIKDTQSVYVSCNRNYAGDFGLAPDEIAGKTDYDLHPRELADKYRADDARVMQSGQDCDVEEHYSVGGVQTWIRTVKTPIRDADGTVRGVLGIFRDITELKRVQEERRLLHEQMTQSQKLESIGRLAGGVAHDFNNMLTVILGSSELILAQLEPHHPLHPEVHEIHTAASRSAELTRQLLAFARRQPVSRKVLDLNASLSGMLKLLERLIGERIELVWTPGDELWPVLMDPGQVDQVLANLCVNARDAISGTGRIVISTENVRVRVAPAARAGALPPGDYVRLSVSDTGGGMDADTRLHLFEPFFTTKAVGQGTGLGLATVYGIVTQNEGRIEVHSEPGHGATFDIYFSRCARAVEEDQARRLAIPAIHGQETILLVEDDPQVMKLTRLMLESLGYRVFCAATPEEAIALAAKRSGSIHLLMTDMVMPGMTGKELAERIHRSHPHIRHLFVTGYMADIPDVGESPAEAVDILEKPFLLADLAGKVREILGPEQGKRK